MPKGFKIPRPRKLHDCPHCSKGRKMQACHLKKHIERQHTIKKENKPRNVNRSKPGHCGTCKKPIKTDFSRHRRIVHNDQKERITPTFGGLAAEEGTLQSSAITENEPYEAEDENNNEITMD